MYRQLFKNPHLVHDDVVHPLPVFQIPSRRRSFASVVPRRRQNTLRNYSNNQILRESFKNVVVGNRGYTARHWQPANNHRFTYDVPQRQKEITIIETNYIDVLSKKRFKNENVANKTIFFHGEKKMRVKKPKTTGVKKGQKKTGGKRKEGTKLESISEAQLNAELENYMKHSKHPRITL